MPLSLAEVLARPVPATKAVVLPVKVASTGPGQALRELAGALRNVPDPVVSLPSLYAVKEAGYRTTPGFASVTANIDETKPGASLRKLAHAVRTFEQERAQQFFEKNARILCALRGLTLLREQANS